MAIIRLRPTTPGQRGVVKVLNEGLHKGKPYEPLLEKQKKTSARNNQGRITVRHKGGGHKQRYRVIDWKRNKLDVQAKVERLEYDPNRTAHLALICYQDGARSYILAPKGLEAGMEIVASENAPIKLGNTLPLNSIPVGTVVCCVELKPGSGAQLARSAGTYAQVLGREGIYVQLRLRSGEVRKVQGSCKAMVGQIGNVDHSLRQYGKAGVKRWLGIRPTVRGVAMNPIDHPHGGGEGKTAAGRHPVSPWGLHTKGYKTRNNKRTDHLIVKSRHRK